jgi:hypothetical protein
MPDNSSIIRNPCHAKWQGFFSFIMRKPWINGENRKTGRKYPND